MPERTSGAALFADISGFTPLTEALTRALGSRRGAEELGHHLNRVYDDLIAEVESYGGSVVSFAGDAITCWFAAETPPGASTSPAVRAATCALAIQQALQRFAHIPIPGQPPAALAVKVSVAAGPARRFLVGDPDLQLIPVVAGTTVARMAAGEHLAAKGEVVVDEATAVALGGLAAIREWREDGDGGWRFACLQELRGEVAPAPWPELPPEALSDGQLRPWLLPAIYERMQAGLGEFLTELRPAVPLFMHFSGIEYDADPEAGAELDAYVRWMQRVVARFDGAVLQVMVGDKGSYAYATFGAPVAHEDDARRALTAALELRRPPAELGFIRQVQIGVSRGTLRTGSYGGADRRTYAVLGDEVNLSARLMQRAEAGQALVSDAARQAAACDFTWERLDPLQLKGKTQPVTVYRLGDAHQGSSLRLKEPRYSLPMVGREAELDRVREALARAREARGQIVGITAEAGLGKSRLVAEVIHLATEAGCACFGGECQSYGTNTPYLAWRSIWQALFDLDPAATPEEQVDALAARVTCLDPELLPRLPLLGVVVNLPIPDNDLTRSFDAKLRKASLEALLVDCLRGMAVRMARMQDAAPLALIVEDCHWFDSLSLDLLEAFARAMADLPLLLVLAYRPPVEPGAPSAGERLASLPYFTELRLTDLGPEQAERLIAAKLRQVVGAEVEVPPLLLERLTTHAQGNPFYIEELLNYLEDRGINPSDPAALEQLALPSSLHSLILSRIDRLGESQKITLKVAAIVGRLFRFTWLWGVYPELGEADRVRHDLDVLGRLDLTSVDQPGPDMVYLFKHIITQEVAYESQPFAMRSLFHGQLGRYLEDTFAATLAQYLDLLAFHYDRSDNLPKRCEYLRLAGEAAQAAFANTAAIDYYRRVLPLLPETEQGELRLRLGEVYEVVGQYAEAEAQYKQALAIAKSREDLPAQARINRALGWLFRKRGDWAGAGPWLEAARVVYASLGDASGVSQVLADVGEIHRLQGRYAEALALYEESLNLSETVADRTRCLATRAHALRGAGTVATYQRDYERARSLFEASLALNRELGNKPGVGFLINNLAVVTRFQGDLETARRLFDESLAICREIGDRWALGSLLNNQGCFLGELGDFAGAGRLLEESLVIGRHVGDRQRISRSLNSLADLRLDQGEYAAARPLLTESLQLCLEIDDRVATAYLLEELAGLAAVDGQPERGLRLAAFAAALRAAAGAHLQAADQARVDRLLDPARRAAGEVAGAALAAEGRGMTLAQAVAEALSNATGESQTEDRCGTYC